MEKLIVGEVCNERIDVFLGKMYKTYSRGYFQRLIKSDVVAVNGRHISSHYLVKPGDEINFEFPEEINTLIPEKIALDIVYEDEYVIVLNKPWGIVVHPACGHPNGTLLNALAGHAEKKFTPLLVHRLDKDTSGIMVVAKNERAKNSLVKQFQSRRVRKTYLVAVQGKISEKKGCIDAPLGRSPEDRKKIVVGPLAKKAAVTEFSLVYNCSEFSLIEAHPITGRTHQIRSHMAFIGHPVLGDKTYGGPENLTNLNFQRQMLHAYKISFIHPETGRRVEFCAEPPDDISSIWKNKSKNK